MTIQTYDTVTLGAVVRALPRALPFLLEKFFPTVRLFNGKKIAFDDIATDRRIAPFVSPVEAGQVVSARGSVMKDFTPAYIKPKHLVDPNRIVDRLPGESIGGDITIGGRRDTVIADNLRMERDAILYRLEWMAAKVVLDGKVTISGEKYPTVEVDFGRDPALTKVLTGTALWTDTVNSDPIEDIENWSSEKDGPTTDIPMGKAAWAAFRKHPKVKDVLDTNIRGTESWLEIGPGAGEDVRLAGILSGTMRVWVYSAEYEDDDGNYVPYVPDNRVILSSPALQGVRAYGAIMDGEANYQAVEYFLKHWVTNDDPFAEYTMTQSAPLLIPARPNASMSATVV